MNCKRCRKFLLEYFDETLAPAMRASVEEHLQTCDECRQTLAQERDFSTSMSQLLRRKTDSLTLRPGIQLSVLKAVESGVPSPKTGRPYRRALLRPALGLAAAAFLAVVAVFAFQRHEPQPTQPAQPVVHHPTSYIMCMATTYTDDTKTDWTERRMIVATRNGGEGYFNIIVRRPPKENQTNQNEREEKS